MEKLFQKTILILIFGIYLQNLTFASKISEGIKFFKGTWEEVLAESRKQNKLIFVNAYANWSKPCKYMDENVYIKEDVAQFYNENFIPYKVDITKGEGEKIFLRYNGKTVPTFLFVDNKQKLIYKKEGGFSPEGFIQVAKNALIVQKLKKQYENGDRSPEFIKTYISILAGTRDITAAKLAQVYFKNLKDEDLLKKENFQFMIDYPRIFKSREFQYFLRNVDKFNKVFGKDCLILVDRVFNELFEKSIKNKDKTRLDAIVEVFAKVKKLVPDVDLEELRTSLYKKYDEIIYKKTQKK